MSRHLTKLYRISGLIDLNAHRLPISLQTNAHLYSTQNCSSMLRRVCKTDAGEILWVDAICINQRSTSERNRQVELMGQIFQRAERVLVKYRLPAILHYEHFSHYVTTPC